MTALPDLQRCDWGEDPALQRYHDTEWGVPLHDDRRLFEFLILEGAQAGLSWATILKKRPAYRAAFDDFDPLKVAAYDEQKITALLANPGIVRNRRKIEAAVQNARVFLRLQEAYGSFDAFLWRFVDGKPVQNRWQSPAELPAQTETSRALSRELQRCGMSFVGATICYAFMQAVGMVNDHVVSCFRHAEVARLAQV